MENAILYAGVDELKVIKKYVMELDEYCDRNEELLKETARLVKTLAGKEKEMEDEIESTLKKRRNNIVSSYEDELASWGNKKKKTMAHKAKEKETKIAERKAAETAEHYGENKHLRIDIQTVLQKESLPGACGQSWFYTVFLPRGLKEILILAAVLTVLLAVIPAGLVVLYLTKGLPGIVLGIVYVLFLAGFAGVYFYVHDVLKKKHAEALESIRGLLGAIAGNHKMIREIHKSIQKDTDETQYALEHFDEELNNIDGELQRIAEEEKQALAKFDNETATQLTVEIKERNREELELYREQGREAATEQKKVQEKVDELARMVSKQYEVYLGREMLNEAKLDRLIKHIECGDARNIGEAIAREKGMH